jgi:hypothetical protein
MKSIDQFKAYFESDLKPKFASLEQERLRTIQKYGRNGLSGSPADKDFAIQILTVVYLIFCGYLFMFLLILMGIIIDAYFSEWIVGRVREIVFYTGAILYIVLAFILYSFFIRLLNRPEPKIPNPPLTPQEYYQAFNETCIVAIAEFVFDQFYYERQGMIEPADYQTCQLFRKTYDAYSGQDYFFGKLGETDIEFCELNVTREETVIVRRDNSTSIEKVNRPVYRGLFIKLDFHKNFNGQLFLIPEKTWLQRDGIGRVELIKLEDPEFEKYFKVYGTDQIEARYLLSYSMMENLTEFYRKFSDNPPHLSFVDSQLFIALPQYKNMFETQLQDSLLDFDAMKVHFINMTDILSIIDLLNLNTRIWSK